MFSTFRACIVRTALLLAAVLALHPFEAAAADVKAPFAKSGQLDLRQWNFERDGPVFLAGEWGFFWQKFIDPASPSTGAMQFSELPNAWVGTLVDGTKLGSSGYASYQLEVDCGNASNLSMALPVQHSSARVYVNGREVANQGRPGMDDERSNPAVTQQYVPLVDAVCPFNIVVHIANFEHRRGGMVRGIQLGTSVQMQTRREAGLIRDMGAFGGLALLSLLPILFFFWRRKEMAPLYFGLFGLSCCVFIALSGERAALPVLGSLGWDWFLSLKFLSFYGGLTMFARFVHAAYPREFGRWQINTADVLGAAGALLVLSTPSRVFTQSIPALVAFAVALTVYISWVLVKASMRNHGRGSAPVLLGGLVVVAITVGHDLIFFQHLLGREWIPYGLLLFALAPGFMLARRMASALSAEELRYIEQRERGDLLVRATNAGLLDWDATSGVITYSDRYREIMGYPPEGQQPDIPGFFALIHPDDSDAARESFLAELRNRNVVSAVHNHPHLVYRMRHMNGEYVWVQADGIALRDAQGWTLRFIGSYIDISAAKQLESQMTEQVNQKRLAEQVLSMERDRLQLLVRTTKAGFSDWDAETEVMTYSERYLEMMGYPPGTDTSAWPKVFMFMHDDDSESARAHFNEMTGFTGKPGDTIPAPPMVCRLRKANGSYLWIHAEGVSQIGDGGCVRRIITSYLDISVFREQQELLTIERRRLDLVVRGSRVGIIDWEGSTHDTYYSPRFREILGHAADAETGGWPDYFQVMIHPDDRAHIIGRWVPFIKGTGPEGRFGEFYSSEEYRLVRADGSYVWVEVGGMAVRNDKGFVVRWIAFIIEITERRAQREALRASRDQIAAQASQLERQNEALMENVRLREEVERIARHDIKTPLNSIIAVPRLLREERRLTAEADELLGIVERAGYRILSMVNLSLDLYKMEKGSYVFRPDAVDLSDLVDKVAVDIRSYAASKNVALKLVSGKVQAYAWAEELLCYSLIANLLKNAVEASSEGATVTVTLQHGTAADDGDNVVLGIHNEGMVPAAVRETFFTKYATAGKAGGTGLGTYSARLMARTQDGDVTMHTSAVEGTILRVSLRAAPAGKVPPTARHALDHRSRQPMVLSSLPPLKVLLVDDDEYNLLIVRRFLPCPPLTVTTAFNGRMALAMVEAEMPDIMFVDLDMPVMGGLEAIGLLRQQELRMGRPRSYAVVLSSHDDVETRNRCLAAGFDHYLTKPVTRDLIQQTLLDFVSASTRPAPATGKTLSAGATVPVVVDPDVFELLPGFLISRLQLLKDMDGDIASVDREGLRRKAHQLRGSLALYGFHWAADVCKDIETSATTIEMALASTLAGDLRNHFQAATIVRGETEQ